MCLLPLTNAVAVKKNSTSRSNSFTPSQSYRDGWPYYLKVSFHYSQLGGLDLTIDLLLPRLFILRVWFKKLPSSGRVSRFSEFLLEASSLTKWEPQMRSCVISWNCFQLLFQNLRIASLYSDSTSKENVAFQEFHSVPFLQMRISSVLLERGQLFLPEVNYQIWVPFVVSLREKKLLFS